MYIARLYVHMCTYMCAYLHNVCVCVSMCVYTHVYIHCSNATTCCACSPIPVCKYVLKKYMSIYT